MSNVVRIADIREQRRLTQEEAWEIYVAAQDKAKRTLRLEDGIAAGKAWGEFIALFVRNA